MKNKQQSPELKQFLNTYGLDLKAKIDEIQRQFYGIHLANESTKSVRNSKVQLEIIDDGTRMEYFVDRTDGKSVYVLKIDINDIMLISEFNDDLDPLDALMKIVTHEYMHLLMGHLSEDVRRNVHNWAVNQGNIWLRMPSIGVHQSRSAMYEEHLFQMPKDIATYANNKHMNGDIFNIACDFCINDAIGLEYPCLVPQDYGLPGGLSFVSYYSIIFHLLNSYPKNEVCFDDFASTGAQTPISEHWFHIRGKILELANEFASYTPNFGKKCNSQTFPGKSQDNDGDEDMRGKCTHAMPSDIGKYGFYYDVGMDAVEFFNESGMVNFGKIIQGKLPAAAQRLNTAKIGIWKEFGDVLRDIQSKHQVKRLSMVDKTDDWTMWNRRRDHCNDLLYPGKREIDGALERKIRDISVIMVDISGSMIAVANPLYAFLYFAMEKCQMVVAFYDTEIKAIYESKDRFKLEPFVAGGTLCYNSVKDLERKLNRHISKFVVITDGEDDTLKKVQDEYNATIYVISKSTVRKMKF